MRKNDCGHTTNEYYSIRKENEEQIDSLHYAHYCGIECLIVGEIKNNFKIQREKNQKI